MATTEEREIPLATLAPEANKLFSKALQALAKVSDDITLEFRPNEKCLMKAINHSQSGFFLIELHQHCFFEFPASSVSRLKIPSKNLLIAQKGWQGSDNIRISFSTNTDQSYFKIQVEFFDAQRVLHSRAYSLHASSSDSVTAVYNKDAMPFRLVLESKLLNALLGNFAASVDELAMRMTNEHVGFLSWTESGGDAMSTDVSVTRSDFEEFVVPQTDSGSTELVFPIKEAKSFVAFAEGKIAIRMSHPGMPVVMSCFLDGVWSADVVLATLSEDQTQAAAAAAAQTIHASHGSSNRPRSANATTIDGTQQTEGDVSIREVTSSSMPETIMSTTTTSNMHMNRRLPSEAPSESSQLRRERAALDHSSMVRNAMDLSAIPRNVELDESQSSGGSFLEHDSQPIPTPRVEPLSGTQGTSQRSQRKIFAPETSSPPKQYYAAPKPHFAAALSRNDLEEGNDLEDEEEFVSATPPPPPKKAKR
eukprot:ANDGO_05351.mRNA.1 cell cycle checkpoint control protein RAD9A